MKLDTDLKFLRDEEFDRWAIFTDGGDGTAIAEISDDTGEDWTPEEVQAYGQLFAAAGVTADRLARAVELLREVMHVSDADLFEVEKRAKVKISDRLGFSFNLHMAARSKARAFLAEVGA